MKKDYNRFEKTLFASKNEQSNSHFLSLHKTRMFENGFSLVILKTIEKIRHKTCLIETFRFSFMFTANR
jgi:hypothetical protein